MHDHNNTAHQHYVIGKIDFVDADLVQEEFRIFEMAVHRRIGTVEKRTVHTIHGVDDAMETSTEVADVPHPTEIWCYVLVSRAEAEYGEQDGQYRTNEYGDLEEI